MNHWIRRGLLLCIALLSATGLAFAANTVTISQSGRQFHPGEISISAGDTLHITNNDEFIHQIYIKSDTMNVDTDEKAPGESVDITFPTPGTFEVHCHIHPKMLLVVHVK